MEYFYFILIISSGFLCCSARSREKRTDISFSSDTDVDKYLRDRSKVMDLFKCKKVVMVQWLHSVVPYVDLECQVLGEVSSVHWYFNDTELNTVGSGRFISLSQPHYSKRIFFNSWRDYKLRMLQVTERDNGPYSIKVVGPDDKMQTRDLMLEVMTDYREDKWVAWMDKINTHRKKFKNAKRNVKVRRRELMKELKKRAQNRKRPQIDRRLIFDN